MAEIQCANGGCHHYGGQVAELIVAQVKEHESIRPFLYIRKIHHVVVGYIELSKAGKFQQATWDPCQLIVL